MKRLPILLLAVLAIISCDRTKPDPEHVFDDVFILYSAGYNNLSGDLATDIGFELASSELPAKDDRNAIVVFSHSSKYSLMSGSYYTQSDYKTPTEPVLIRMYRSGSKAVLDTVKRYATDFDEIDPLCIKTVFDDIKSLFPSNGYGMLYSSHGFGWLPARHDVGTKAIGSRFGPQGGSAQNQTDICDFAAALPLHFKYIILDACYMGAVEVAYQLRSCCDRFVASCTEIPAEGFDYVRLPSRLFAPGGADLEQACKDYISGSSLGGTVSVIDCTALEGLASLVAGLCEKYRSGIAEAGGAGRSTVQRYWLRNEYRYFYDLRDIFRAAGATEADLVELDAKIGDAVMYEEHTKSFNAGLGVSLERCCGLAMYLPYEYASEPEINDYYATLDFCKATRLLE